MFPWANQKENNSKYDTTYHSIIYHVTRNECKEGKGFYRFITAVGEEMNPQESLNLVKHVGKEIGIVLRVNRYVPQPFYC